MFGAVMFAGCSEAGPEAITWRYGPAIRYAGLGETFAWFPHNPRQMAYHYHGNTQFEQLVHRTLEGALTAKGFQPAADKSANFWIDYRLGKRDVEDSNINPHGEVFQEGSLVLDVLDPKTSELIWRGVVQARIDDTAPPVVREKRLRLGIERLMRDFPAK
jgi:hypothetical protein